MATINKTQVIIKPDKTKVLSWCLNPGTDFTSDKGVYIQWRRAGGEWLDLAGPVYNACSWEDPHQYNWAKDRDLYYRIRIGDTYGPQARAGDGFLDKRDSAMYFEIIRKENLQMRYAGVDGWFLRRKHWGDKCTDCTDWDTGEVTNGLCQTCYGTGFVGGYYESIPYKVNLVQQPVVNKHTDGNGLATIDEQNMFAKALAEPLPDSFDLWIQKDTNDRYVIRKLTYGATFKGIPITVQTEMRKLPVTDIAYKVPIKE